MRDGMLKDDIMANFIANIVSSFRDITAKCSWPYYDVFFDRSILGKELCRVIGMLSPINSFSLHKEETAKRRRCIRMSMSGFQKMKLTRQGLLVSITINDRTERKYVKTYVDYNTFFIEWKTKKEHRIIGIHLPKGIHKKHNRSKRKMEDRVFYATIACSVKKRSTCVKSSSNYRL
ncbi:hypothetical protein HanPI659440_Chr08g0294281 [Helianthus annuus]|nr:hypothetical protein HanPI659440_Chr08g0294281 [Helianthus annuus]